MSLILNPTETTNATTIIGEGQHVFEANMPGGADWTSGLTIDVDIESAYEDDVWETLHTFEDKGTWKVYLVYGRSYRVVASAAGAWVALNVLKDRISR